MALLTTATRRLSSFPSHFLWKRFGCRYLSTASWTGYEGYTALLAGIPSPYVLHIELNRPNKANCINDVMWTEIRDVFKRAGSDPMVRAIVLSGQGKNFCAGIDLELFMGLSSKIQAKDPARKAYMLNGVIKNYQEGMTAIEQCPKPVIAAIHRYCVGAGVDCITACDIRYCSNDTKFSVKEVGMGIAADVGTLARLPRVIKSDSAVRDWCLTGRDVAANEAFQEGLVSKVLETRNDVIDYAISTAQHIAALSPIAVTGTKVMLNYGREHGVSDCNNYVAAWNMAMLQNPDIETAVKATMTKQNAIFADLEGTKSQ